MAVPSGCASERVITCRARLLSIWAYLNNPHSPHTGCRRTYGTSARVDLIGQARGRVRGLEVSRDGRSGLGPRRDQGRNARHLPGSATGRCKEAGCNWDAGDDHLRSSGVCGNNNRCFDHPRPQISEFGSATVVSAKLILLTAVVGFAMGLVRMLLTGRAGLTAVVVACSAPAWGVRACVVTVAAVRWLVSEWRSGVCQPKRVRSMVVQALNSRCRLGV